MDSTVKFSFRQSWYQRFKQKNLRLSSGFGIEIYYVIVEQGGTHGNNILEGHNRPRIAIYHEIKIEKRMSKLIFVLQAFFASFMNRKIA